MSAVCWGCLLFLSLVSLLVLGLCAAHHTTCEIQAEYPTEKASLKCNFSENLLQTKKGFCVKHYRDFNDTKGDIVVECIWMPRHAKHHCHAKTKDGYNYSSIESNTLTMVIQNATAKYEGRYQCLVDCVTSDGARECQFTLPTAAHHTTCEIQAEYPTEKASLKCNFSENLLQTKKGFCVKHYRDFNDTKGDIVVECIWMPRHAKHHCHAKTKDGYNYSSIESNTLTMVIQNATAKYEGRYQCLVDCVTSDGARECQFMLPTAAHHTTCEIQAEYPTEKASLKCNFSENLLQTKKGFCVKHYRDFNDTKGDVVVECIWMPRHAKHHCHAKTKDGYNYSSIESNTLTMVIQNATAKYEGRYQCLVDCVTSDGARECQFMLPTVSGEKQQSSKLETVITPVIVSLLLILITGCGSGHTVQAQRRYGPSGTAEIVPMRTIENNESNLPNGTAGAFTTGSTENNEGNPNNLSNGTELASSEHHKRQKTTQRNLKVTSSRSAA